MMLHMYEFMDEKYWSRIWDSMDDEEKNAFAEQERSIGSGRGSPIDDPELKWRDLDPKTRELMVVALRRWKNKRSVRSNPWKDRVRTAYSSLGELKAYDRVYNIVERLGYGSARELWDDNPVIGGSVHPEDLRVMRPSERLPRHGTRLPPARGNPEDDYPEEAGPGDEDIVINDSEREAFYAGKLIAETREVDWDELSRRIVAWMDKNRYWPDVWHQDDHGGWSLVTADVHRYAKFPPVKKWDRRLKRYVEVRSNTGEPDQDQTKRISNSGSKTGKFYRAIGWTRGVSSGPLALKDYCERHAGLTKSKFESKPRRMSVTLQDGEPRCPDCYEEAMRYDEKRVRSNTGEPDQDYDHGFFDEIVRQLAKAGFKGATHRQFDLYQGVYLSVPSVDTFWITDSYFTGKPERAGGERWKKAELVDPEGYPVSSSKGDYFTLPKDHVFEGYLLRLMSFDGKRKEIENPTVGDLPDIMEVQSGPKFKKGTRIEVTIFQGEKSGKTAGVTSTEDGAVDASELTALCKKILRTRKP